MENNNYVDVVFVLDMSGSMDHLTDDVIGGYNSLIKRVKEMDAKVLISTIVFNDKINIVKNRVPVTEIPELTKKDYCPSGCTALLDAVGSTLDRLEEEYKEMPADQTIIYITTDGMENSSREYNYKMVNKMIKWHQEKNNWEINFLAANIDEKAEGERLGVSMDNCVSFDASHDGMTKCMMRMESDIRTRISRRRDNKNMPDWLNTNEIQ